MQITISQPVIDQVVRGIMENFPEASQGCALRCVGWKYDAMRFRFEDGETGETYALDQPKLLAAFRFLFTDKWPKGCQPPPAADDAERWDDWLCRCDAVDFDAFAQLACLGEVIYG